MSQSSFRSAAALFSATDRRRLRRALAQAHQAQLYRRLDAVLLVADGYSLSEAARRARVARRTVQRWVARYRTTHDPAALAQRPHPGRPRVAPHLTAARLAAALARDPRTVGYRATTWTVALLAHYFQHHEALPISARTLRRRLHALDYRWKRPRYVYAGRAAHLAQKKGGSTAA